MPEPRWHVSSAVVRADPAGIDALCDRIAALPGVEVHARDGARLVVTIEGTSTGQLGDRLTEINLMPGVLSAAMVFEHVEETEDPT